LAIFLTILGSAAWPVFHADGALCLREE